MRRVSIAVLGLLVILLLGCQAPAPPPPPDTSAEDKAAIEATTPVWEEAFNAGDAATIAGLYTPDGILYPPNAEPVQGREAIQAFWQGVIDTGIKGKLVIEETGVDGDMGFKLGTFELMTAEGEPVDMGHWMEVWMRTDEGWFSARDMWNSDMPAADAE